MTFNIRFLPARYGDCIWIEYGDQKINRILIDGGTQGTRHSIQDAIDFLPENERHFELMMVTHIDRDHIEGILGLLESDQLNFTADDFWFNGWIHLPDTPTGEFFGAVQGERLTDAILRHQAKQKLKWNDRFEGNAVVTDKNNKPKTIRLPGGMKFTLLSPTAANLYNLKDKWLDEVTAAGLTPGQGMQDEVGNEDEPFGAGMLDIDALASQAFHEDTAAANGSSIAVLAEYAGKKALLAGDAYPSVVLAGLNQLFRNGKVEIDLVKLSHHASAHNTSPDLLEKLKSKKFVISTNGSIFKHPSPPTVARVIKIGERNKELIFNYRTDINKVWDNAILKEQFKYSTIYPAAGKEGIEVQL